jgi:recombinational DNA repair protein (RecF pathway)
MAEQCAMIVGYLVPHRCPNQALATCIKCGRKFCDEHVSIVQGGLICLACQQGIDQPVLVSQVAQDYTADDIAVFSRVGELDSADDTFSDLS